MLIFHLHIFFVRITVQSLAHFLIELFVFLLLSFKNYFYILDTSPLSCKHFLPVCGLSFHSLNREYLHIFYLIPSRCYIILSFTFRSVIHFQLIFVEGVRSVSKTTFLHTNAQLFQHLLLKCLSFLCCITLAPLSKISWQYLCEPITQIAISPVSLIYLSIILQIPCYLNY